MTTEPLDNETAAELLASKVYGRAFTKAMSGSDALLDDDERIALRRAKELTNTTGPGYPMPTQLDPTRTRTE